MEPTLDPARTAPPGIPITRVRGYNLVVTAFFGGRRTAVNRALVAASGARPGHRVLDVGCGPGHLARALAATVGPHGEVVGVDPSPPMIEYARRRARRLAQCRFQLGDAQSLELPDATFDVVTSTFAMHHIPAQERATAITHMFRVLRPGGRLLIADLHPTGNLVPAVIRALTRVTSRHRADRRADPFDELDLRRHTNALRHAGFVDLAFAVVKPWTGYLTAVTPQ